MIADDNTGPAVVGAGQHQHIVYSSGDESDLEAMDDNDDESGDAERDVTTFQTLSWRVVWQLVSGVWQPGKM